MYLWNDPDATVVRAAREANAAMPAYAFEQLGKQLGNLSGVRVVMLDKAILDGRTVLNRESWGDLSVVVLGQGHT